MCFQLIRHLEAGDDSAPQAVLALIANDICTLPIPVVVLCNDVTLALQHTRVAIVVCSAGFKDNVTGTSAILVTANMRTKFRVSWCVLSETLWSSPFNRPVPATKPLEPGSECNSSTALLGSSEF
jgi:hypothetical protein